MYLGLTALLASPALAQQAGLPKPAQSIALDDHSMVAGAVALPNHNTVLLLTSSATSAVVAQCLAPDGHTLWKTTLNRYQHAASDWHYALDTRNIAIGRDARERKQLTKERATADLWPSSVYTDGDNLVLAEKISASGAKDADKNSPVKLRENQVFVQRLDAEGRLTQHLFEPPAAPESRKIEVWPLGRYADASGFVEIVRETNAREETTILYLQHYDLATKALRREPVTLPATPKQPNSMFLRHWYQDWSYLGHRAGQTYFSRRTLEGGPKAKPGDLPVNFEVCIVDDHGAAAAPGGFRTTLELNPGTRVAYSGHMPILGEASHVPAWYDMPQGKSYIRVDEYDISSGGTGGFYLDHETGEVLVYGEYGVGEDMKDGGPKLAGFFMRRYAPDGRVLARSQSPYTVEMQSFGRNYHFKGNMMRNTRFHVDPLSGHYQFSSTYRPEYDNNETYSLYFNHDLNLVRYDHPTDKGKGEPTYTFVHFAQPTYTTTNFSAMQDLRVYEHAHASELPLYASLEKLRRTAPAEVPYYNFYLSPTGNGKALVVESPLGLGGKLNVYTF